MDAFMCSRLNLTHPQQVSNNPTALGWACSDDALSVERVRFVYLRMQELSLVGWLRTTGNNETSSVPLLLIPVVSSAVATLDSSA